MHTIYRNSPVPRYHQLKEILRERIQSGEWKAGDLIPSERELSEQYGISRMTTRQAITDLVNEALRRGLRDMGTRPACTSARRVEMNCCHALGTITMSIPALTAWRTSAAVNPAWHSGKRSLAGIVLALVRFGHDGGLFGSSITAQLNSTGGCSALGL